MTTAIPLEPCMSAASCTPPLIGFLMRVSTMAPSVRTPGDPVCRLIVLSHGNRQTLRARRLGIASHTGSLLLSTGSA